MKYELGVAKDKIDTADIVALYNEEKSALECANKTLNVEHNSNVCHIEFLEKQLKQIEEDMKKPGVDASSIVVSIRTQLATSESELHTTRTLYHTTQQSLTDASAEVTRCQSELSTAKTKLSDQEHIIEEQRKNIAVIQDGLATANARGDRIDSELKNLRDQLVRSHLSTSSGSEPVELRKDLVVLLGKLRGLMEFDFKSNAIYDDKKLLERIVRVILSMFNDGDREASIASLIVVLEELLDALKNGRYDNVRHLLHQLQVHSEDGQQYPGTRHEGDHTERTRVEKLKEENFLAEWNDSVTRPTAKTPAKPADTPAAVTTADQPPGDGGAAGAPAADPSLTNPRDTLVHSVHAPPSPVNKPTDKEDKYSRAAASQAAAETRGSGRDGAAVGTYEWHENRFEPVNRRYNGR
jgi:hypothetical protein